MPTSTHCLEKYVNNCAAASPNSLKTQQLAGVSTAIEQAAVGCSVANIASLPGASNNKGRFIFVEDIGAYRYSNGAEWLNSYTTTPIVLNILYGVGDNALGQLASGSTVAQTDIEREFTVSLWCCVSGQGTFVGGVKNDGTLWSWGCGQTFGTQGDGTNYGTVYSSPVQEFYSDTTWCHIDRTNQHTTALKSDGSLWSWGINGDGQQMLGFCQFIIGSTSPVQEYTSSSWVTSTHSNGVYGIKSDNTLWAAGNGTYGRLATNDLLCYSSPVQEVTSSLWVKVGADNHHASAIKTNGTLWSWGYGGCGEIGNNSVINRSSPVQEASSSTNWCQTAPTCNSTVMLKTDGTMWAIGYNLCGHLGFLCGHNIKRSSPVQEVSSSTNWCGVYAKCRRTKIIKTDGSL